MTRLERLVVVRSVCTGRAEVYGVLFCRNQLGNQLLSIRTYRSSFCTSLGRPLRTRGAHLQSKVTSYSLYEVRMRS
jgi:hypothetical protein